MSNLCPKARRMKISSADPVFLSLSHGVRACGCESCGVMEFLSALIERLPRYLSLNTDSRQKESAPLSFRSIPQQQDSTHSNCAAAPQSLQVNALHTVSTNGRKQSQFVTEARNSNARLTLVT